MRALIALALLVCGVAGCRDAVEPLDLDDRPPLDEQSRRLTYSPFDDRAPHWSAGGDSVYYTASAFDGVPGAPAIPLSIPRDGEGPARTILRNVQVGSRVAAWIGATALSDDGQRVAYIELMPTRPPLPCVTESPPCSSLPGMPPLPVVPLTSMVLHARMIDSDASLDQDASIAIPFHGYSEHTDPARPTGGYVRSRYHMSQLGWVLDGDMFFRPSWSPDGARLVVSDGLRLVVWEFGAEQAVPVPGGQHGLDPAWSPTGEWIAFTRATPVDSSTVTCQYFVGSGPTLVHACDEERIHYQFAPLEVVLIAPDGSGQQVLGAGREPAFSPDGQTVYYVTSAGVRAAPLDGGEGALVPGTQGAREPAVSPDATWLAFSRQGTAGRDVWVVKLP